jgi:hypothetical protein
MKVFASIAAFSFCRVLKVTVIISWLRRIDNQRDEAVMIFCVYTKAHLKLGIIKNETPTRNVV